MIKHKMRWHRCNLNYHRHKWLIYCTKENCNTNYIDLNIHTRHQISQVLLTIMTSIYILPQQIIQNILRKPHQNANRNKQKGAQNNLPVKLHGAQMVFSSPIRLPN